MLNAAAVAGLEGEGVELWGNGLCTGWGREDGARCVSEDTATSLLRCILCERIRLQTNRPEPVYRGRNLVFLLL